MKEVDEKTIVFAKTKDGAKIPTKKDEDAGYDMYACFDEDYFVILPGKTRPVPTGIAMAYNKMYYGQIEERGSMAKLGIKKSGGVFDSGYRGEYLIMTYNTNDKPFVISKIPAEELAERIEIDGMAFETKDCIIYPYTKAICQIVMQIVPTLNSSEVSYEELLKIESERKSGRFGSSNK